jgi:hypothetical protein
MPAGIYGSFDVLIARTGQRTNEIVKLLARIGGLPAGALIAGIMGMNFKPALFTHPELFWVTVAIIASIAVTTRRRENASLDLVRSCSSGRGVGHSIRQVPPVAPTLQTTSMLGAASQRSSWAFSCDQTISTGARSPRGIGPWRLRDDTTSTTSRMPLTSSLATMWAVPIWSRNDSRSRASLSPPRMTWMNDESMNSAYGTSTTTTHCSRRARKIGISSS